MNKRLSILLVAFLFFAALGVVFSAISTADFVAHFDRQVHSITCSFTPGLSASDKELTSGCLTVMMSPYSSVFRDSTWGGIPISLPSLSVFAYLVWLGLSLLFGRKHTRPAYLAYMIAAAALPAITSIAYWYISVSEIGAVCKVCVMIYVASFGALLTAIAALILSIRGAEDRDENAPAIPWMWFGGAFAGGVLFVAIPLAIFMALKPAYTDEMGRCGELLHPEDKYNTRITADRTPGAIPAIELVDPLCPACRAFRDRLEVGGLKDRLSIEYVMFPLDNTCNWMVSDALHPGACTMAEAVLCGGDRAMEVMNWSLDNQEELKKLGASSPQQLIDRVKGQFPFIADCVGKPAVKSRINKSLRWVISNTVKVMTPQLYVNGVKLCDEDSDLGMDYALKRLIEKTGKPAAGSAVPATSAGRQ